MKVAYDGYKALLLETEQQYYIFLNKTRGNEQHHGVYPHEILDDSDAFYDVIRIMNNIIMLILVFMKLI